MRSFALLVLVFGTLYLGVPLLIHFSIRWLGLDYPLHVQSAIALGTVLVLHGLFRRVLKDQMPRV